MAKRRSKRKPQFEALRPTPEREARNPTQSAGMARRIKPMIDIYRAKGLISAAEHEILEYYRSQAHAADRSPIRSCCDTTPLGGGLGPSMAITSASLEVARMHRQLSDHNPGDAPSLIAVLEAIARDDKSITQHCIDKYGGRERYGKDGAFIAMVPVKERHNTREERRRFLTAARIITR